MFQKKADEGKTLAYLPPMIIHRTDGWQTQLSECHPQGQLQARGGHPEMLGDTRRVPITCVTATTAAANSTSAATVLLLVKLAKQWGQALAHCQLPFVPLMNMHRF